MISLVKSERKKLKIFTNSNKPRIPYEYMEKTCNMFSAYLEKTTLSFKHINIIDPILEYNNLAKSVNYHNSFKIKKAIVYTQKKIKKILELKTKKTQEQYVCEFLKFFNKTIKMQNDFEILPTPKIIINANIETSSEENSKSSKDSKMFKKIDFKMANSNNSSKIFSKSSKNSSSGFSKNDEKLTENNNSNNNNINTFVNNEIDINIKKIKDNTSDNISKEKMPIWSLKYLFFYFFLFLFFLFLFFLFFFSESVEEISELQNLNKKNDTFFRNLTDSVLKNKFKNNFRQQSLESQVKIIENFLDNILILYK